MHLVNSHLVSTSFVYVPFLFQLKNKFVPFHMPILEFAADFIDR